MNKPKNILRIAVLPLIATILLIPASQQTQTFAEEKKSTSVNDVELRAIFYFRERNEVVDTFKLFDTLSTGFDRTKPVNFKLEGIVGGDKPMLYRAVDTTFNHGRNSNHDYSEFDVDVIFQHEGQPYRQLTYSDCQVKNYNIFTEFDKDKNYNGNSKWAYVDKFEFECRGFTPVNPAYEYMLKMETKQKTENALKIIEEKKNGKQ
ncbi:MAG: hypothetical protein WDZ43_00755 [Nitrosopumilaceae archaeon]